MKKFLMVLLTLAVAFSLVTVAAAEPVAVTVISFESGKLGDAIDAASNSADRNTITDLTVSSGVLNATDWATMKDMTGLVNIDLSGTTCENNEIPSDAFNNYNGGNATNGPKINLVSLVFPQGVTTIQKGAFAHCYNLEFSGDWLPTSVTTLNPLAFQDCKTITSVDLSRIKFLGRQAFQRTGLTGTITLPDNLILKSNKNVGNFYIFDGCTGITEIVLGKNIQSMDAKGKTEPFSYIGGNLFSGTSVTTFTVPGDIEWLGGLGQFSGNGCVLTIKDGVKYLGYYFADNGTKTDTAVASNLVGEVSIPSSVIEISSIALSRDDKITKVEYHGPATGAGNISLINYLYMQSTVQEIDLSGSGTTEFRANVGQNNTALKKVDLSNCTALTSVSIAAWSKGGMLNLVGCTSLNSIYFGSGNDGTNSSGFTLLVDNADVLAKISGGASRMTLVVNGGTVDTDKTGFAAVSKPGHTAKWYEYVEGDNDYSDNTEVTAPVAGKTYIAQWEKATYTPSEASLDFGSAVYGYTVPTGKEVTFTTNDSVPAIKSVTGSASFDAAIDGLKVTVTPKTGRGVATHSEEISVVLGNGDTAKIPATMKVTPAPLTATYAGETIKTGRTPELKVTVTGFVNGETDAVLTAKPTLSGDYDVNTIGEYTLTPMGGTADNYTFTTYTGGVLKVERRSSGGGGAPTTDQTVSSPKTFDPGIAVYAGMALMSAAGAVYVTKKR